jgi:hypothetical protein
MVQQRFLLTCAAVFALALPASAMAGTLTLTMTPSSQPVTQGELGYVLGFFLTTTGSVDLSGFNVTVTTDPSSGISFTGYASVAGYIFAPGNSSGLGFSNPTGPNTADINDLTIAAYQTVTAGTYGLGEIYFSVASDAPIGSLNITLDSATSFTDNNTNPLDYSPGSNVTIGTVVVGASSVVPEPSSLLMSAIGIATGLVSLAKRRQLRLKA